jgi:hypothetical protein
LCGVVVGGSDHGTVYVFDRKTASIVQLLQHSDCNMVQTITVRSYFFSVEVSIQIISPQTHDSEDTNTIASASSGPYGVVSISIWTRKPARSKHNKCGDRPTICHVTRMEIAIFLLFAIAMAILLHQNTLEVIVSFLFVLSWSLTCNVRV